MRRPLRPDGDHRLGDRLFRLGGNEGRGHRVKRRILPAFQALAQYTLIFFGNAYRVGGARREIVQIREYPARAEFRAGDRRTGPGRIMTDKKFFVVNEKRHVFQNMLQRVGPFKDGRLGSVSFVGLGDEQRALRQKLRRTICYHALLHSVDALQALFSDHRDPSSVFIKL
ncbi:hypothetical protein SDC9_155749 [bioreactor metagenome]|uniref:Uncharacterized protein n=1 Tax=bioreactor metagenome TaxID=1076179 RepID=A0A645F2M1_9ZZZZ